MRRIAQRSRGFSLIEVTVAMAVGAIIMLALMDWFGAMSKQQRGVSQKMITLDISNTLQTLMSTAGQCTANMSKVVSWPTSNPGSVNLPAPGLRIFNLATGAPMSVVVAWRRSWRIQRRLRIRRRWRRSIRAAL